MTPFVNDPDFTLYVGDALEVLAGLPDESVHCCVTSPPYWGLRDYGTGTWDGGDTECDHLIPGGGPKRGLNSDGHNIKYEVSAKAQRESCRKCGATRVDRQLGLESTPEAFVARMVAVFAEIRRVLRSDGTCWLNIGDSYAQYDGQGNLDEPREAGLHGSFRVSSRLGEVAENRGPGRHALPPGFKRKDLVGVPWRLAFALQQDGWYLRSDIIWAKPNPMPESVTDRPTKAHEYLFLLTRSPRYFYDADAIREPVNGNTHARGNGVNPKALENAPGSGVKQNASFSGAINELVTARNKRSVWEIATESYPEAHFATFPQALVEPCVKVGCPEWVCGTCGKARERIVETTRFAPAAPSGGREIGRWQPDPAGGDLKRTVSETIGFSDCGHDDYRSGVVLDPFMGSGTTALVARRLGRRSIGIELNADYARLAASRLQQLSLLAVT